MPFLIYVNTKAILRLKTVAQGSILRQGWEPWRQVKVVRLSQLGRRLLNEDYASFVFRAFSVRAAAGSSKRSRSACS